MNNISDVKNNPAIKRIVIVGAGMTGSTFAAGLARGLHGADIEIVLIDNPSLREQDYYCEATTPAVSTFHKFLGINEKEFIAAVGASYKLANHYKNWSYAGQDYYLPFSAHGFMLQRLEFQHFFVSHHRALSNHYDDFSLAAVAARLSRFCHPSTDSSSLYSTLAYGLHIPCIQYENYLKDYAKKLGVTFINTEVTSLYISPATGLVEYLSIGNTSIAQDGKLYADFFVDCTGAQAWLMSQLQESILHSEFSSGRSSNECALFTNSCASFIQPVNGDIPVATSIELTPVGWRQQIPAQHFNETRYFFNDNFSQPESIIKSLLETHPSCDITIRHHTPGQRQLPWYKNCLCVGESASNAEVFVAGKLHWVQSALLRFLSLFPADNCSVIQSREYNRLTQAEFEHIADFHSLHYFVAQPKPDLLFQSASFWQEVASKQYSAALLHKVSLFKERATFPFYENETFTPDMWISLLLGNRVFPESYHPLVNDIDPEWVSLQLGKMKTMMASAAAAMPAHHIYLRENY